MKKSKKPLILIISISVTLLIAAVAIWQFSSRSYEGVNEIQKFKNYIEINYQSAAGRKKAIEEAAEDGNAVAQYYLGICHTQGGLGVSKDYKEAMKWWEKAAENGNVHAQSKLGDCYRRGRFGVSKDKKESAKWYKKAGESYKKAAEAGDPAAQYRLGRMYAWGQLGISRDKKTAFKWWKKAAENGNSDAQLILGQCYKTGMLGTPKSNYDAKKWYNKSAEQGNFRALQALAGLYAEGGEYKKAIELWKKVADKGIIGAKFCLMRCYELGLGVPKDDIKVAAFLKIYEQKNPLFLGYAYYSSQNGLPNDKTKAAEYFKKAAKSANKRTRKRALAMLKRMKIINY